MRKDTYKAPRTFKRNSSARSSSAGRRGSSFRTRSTAASLTKPVSPKLTKSYKYDTRSKVCENIRLLKVGKRIIVNFKTVITTFGKDPPPRTLGASVWNGGNLGNKTESQVKYKETARVCCPAVVRFLGKTSFAKGDWVGVELMRPIGRHDGTVNGIRYFQAEDNCGLFVKPRSVHLCQPDGTFGGIRWEELEDMRLESIHMKMILLRPPFSPEAKASSRGSSHAMDRDRNGNARRIPTRNRVPAPTPVLERAARLQTSQKKSSRRAPSRRDAVQQRIVWSDDDEDQEEVDAGDEDSSHRDFSLRDSSHRDPLRDSHKDPLRDSQEVSQRLRAARSAISRQNAPNSTAHSWAPSGSKPDDWSPSGSAASRLNRSLARLDSFPEPEPQYRKGSMHATNESIPGRKLAQWQLEERQQLWDWMRGRNLIAAPDASSHATPLPHYEHLYAPAKNSKLFHALLKVGITSVPQLRAANLWNLANAGAITNDDAGCIVQAFLIDPKTTPAPVRRSPQRRVSRSNARTTSPPRRSRNSQAKVFGSSTLRSLTPYRTPRSHASDRVLSRTAPVNVLSDLTPFRTPSTYAPARGLSSTAPLMAQQVFSPQDDGLRRCEMCCGELDAHIAGYALPIPCNECKKNVEEGECVYRCVPCRYALCAPCFHASDNDRIWDQTPMAWRMDMMEAARSQPDNKNLVTELMLTPAPNKVRSGPSY